MVCAVSDIFDVHYGVNLALNAMTIEANGINFVSRTSVNNGVSTKVRLIEGIEPIEAGVLTVAGGGSVLETFLQAEPFYSGRDLYFLRPKCKMTRKQKLFFCMCIRANKFRYNYGRQANKTLRNLQIPSLDEIPEWVDLSDLNRFSDARDTVIDSPPSAIEHKKWELFKLKELFKITGSKTTPKNKLKKYGDGNYPYITTRATNNGVDGFYNYYTESVEDGGVLTVDSAAIGCTLYQPKDFSASDHVEKLIPKFEMNAYTAMFLVAVLNLEKHRYSYGRKASQDRMKKISIKLPAINDRQPDFEFMENYIKSLPYSSNL